MRVMKKCLPFILAIAMVITMLPGRAFIANAEEQQNDSNQIKSAQDQGGSNSDDQNSDASSETTGDSSAGSESGSKESDANASNDNDRSKTDKGDADSDENSKPANEPEKARTKAPAKLPSGSVGSGWEWKISGDEGDYTLTFEYTGTADPAPDFEVPADFISNISDELGDINDDITKLVIPKGCTKIGNKAFKDLGSLKEAELGSSVTTIGDNAFNGCSSLEKANLEDTSVYSIGEGAFRYCNLKKVELPDSIAKNSSSKIGQYAFANNKSLKSVDIPAFFYIRNLSTYIFADCEALEDVSFRKVSGSTQRVSGSTYRTSLPSYTFNNDTSLKTIDLSAYDADTQYSYFYLYSYYFQTNQSSGINTLPKLEKIILPEKKITINSYAFYGKSGINSFDQFENKEYINLIGGNSFQNTDIEELHGLTGLDSIGSNAFQNSNLTNVDLSDSPKLTLIGQEAFKDCTKLKNAVVGSDDSNSSIQISKEAFRNCTSLNEVSIGSDKSSATITLGQAAFKNDDNLKVFNLSARTLKAEYTDLFSGANSLEEVNISSNVKSLSGDFLASIPKDAKVNFEGENIINITAATGSGGARPLKNMSGKYYVDPKGVLYKLNDDNTASLAYVPAGVAAYTVPGSVKADGKDYEITSVSAYSMNKAKDLMQITFEHPEKVYLKAHAFAGWTTSDDNMGKTVNGENHIIADKWNNVSADCDFPLSEKQGKLVPYIESLIKDSDGKETLKTIVTVNGKNPADDGTYDYKTGQIATYTIAINNNDNIVLDKVVRIYFSYSEDGYNLGSFTVGESFIENSATGSRYPFKMVQTDNPDIYYYEITGIKPGETLAFQNDIHYPSPGTPGGEVKIWTHTITQEKAKEYEGKVINPGDYMELDWYTEPAVYDYSKSNVKVYDTESASLQSPMIKTSRDGDAYVSSLAYRLSESNQGSSAKSEGLDYIRWVNYSDEITLPDELYWREEIIDAIQNGRYKIENVSTSYDETTTGTLSCKAVTVTVSGKKYYVAYLGVRAGYSSNSIDNLKPEITSDGNLRFSWKVSNSSLSGQSASNEYSVHSFFLKVGDEVLLADLDKVNDLLDRTGETDLRKVLFIHNDTDEVRHYSYSKNQDAESEVTTPVGANSGVLINKTFQKNDNSASSVYAGKDEFFDITINNTGILNIKEWGKAAKDDDGNETYDRHIVSDNLSNWLYIEPDNIEKMLADVAVLGTGKNAAEAEIGKWLTLTITRGSVFTKDNYQVQDGTDQTDKYTTDKKSDISYGNDGGARVVEGIKIVFTRQDDGTINAVISGDTDEANNRTFIIGKDGEYKTIKEFFDAIGYMPTVNTVYSADYNLPADEDFTLKAGQKIVFPIRSSYKTTPMMLSADSQERHPTSSNAVRNSATVSLKAGKDNVSKTVSTKNYHYWQRELFMYKAGYIEGNSSEIKEDALIDDGTVIDSRLSFYNYSQKAYEHINVSDYMDGPQVALAPVYANKGLKDPDGNEPEKYTSNGVEYYVLNKAGEYKNVVFGSAAGRNSAQNLVADITVAKTSDTSLDTLIKWKPYDNWGGTSTTTYIYYKVLVSASMAGVASDAKPGESATYTLKNKAWLGDHQGHRLWDSMGYTAQIYSFSKKIITPDGKKDGSDSVDKGTLVDFQRIRQSDKVSYQIQIDNISGAATVLTGNRIKDVLPRTYAKFKWEKDINVSNLRYYGTEGLKIKYGLEGNAIDISTEGKVDADKDNYWSVSAADESKGIYQINWDKDFKIYFPAGGTLKILVDLDFPARPDEGASPWDQYVTANAGNILENRFYIDSMSDYVEHLLESEGKAVLYKGVYDTGITTRYPGRTDTTYSYSRKYYSNNTRLIYENGNCDASEVKYNDPNLKASTITYYTVLYNGGYDRLYLSELQDQLPRGFHFQSMCNTSYYDNSYMTGNNGNYTDTSTSAYSSSNYVGYTGNARVNVEQCLSEGYSYATGTRLVSIDNKADEYDNNTVKFINARIVSSSSKGKEGREHITFKIQGSPSSANGSAGVIKYDSEMGKYYLNPGEAVRFGYNVLIDKPDNTDDMATNTITMPYYDYSNTGFTNAADNGTVQKAREVSGITANDGGCVMMTGSQVEEEYGVDTSKYKGDEYNTLNGDGGNYMVSSVTVERAPITPGIQKTIGGLTPKLTNPGTKDIEGSKGSDINALYGRAYQGGAKSSDVVNWKLRVFNEAAGKNDEASGMMTNYTLTDTVDGPYGFTGQVFCNLYRAGSAAGTKLGNSSQYLFTIGTRKKDDTSVNIASGSSLSSAKSLRIGDSEDDSDDDWFSFGSGLTSGRVKIERDPTGDEIMTIQLSGGAYAVPAGCWADFCVHTMYRDDVVIVSDTKYNDVILSPEQDYNAGNVAQGRALTHDEYDASGKLIKVNDGIQSGASITITQGYTTTSWKKITENDNKNNNARSDQSKNYISLSEKTKDFKYDLYVIGPSAVMSKIVLIDDLPHIGDHSAFVEKDKRFSEFGVGFLEDNLDLKVSVSKKGSTSETWLTADQYEAFVTEKTVFDKKDWEGIGDGWINLSGLSDKERTETLKKAKSVRVIIKDPNAWQRDDQSKYLMDSECQIHVSFNAKIDDPDAEPGQIAWNSFGYEYQVPQTQNGTEENSFGISLEAQPLNVGIKYPAAPLLTKKLSEEVLAGAETSDGEDADEENNATTEIVPRKAENDIKLGFIIYEGSRITALDDALSMKNADIASALAGSSRKYIYIPYTVKKGESTAEKGLWKVDYCSRYDSAKDAFVDSEAAWHWENGKTYSIIELKSGDYGYELAEISAGNNKYDANNQEFTNSNETNIALTADNRRSTTDLMLTKNMPERVDVGGDASEKNSTAVFKVEGRDSDGNIIYTNTVGIEFDDNTGASETRVLHDVPVGASVTVTEVYSGNYSPAGESSITLKAPTEYKGDMEEYRGKYIWQFEFTNKHDKPDEPGDSSGAVNKYEVRDNEINYLRNGN